MKIAALAPQFLIEVPPGIDAGETQRVASELRQMKHAEAEAASASDQATLDNETREGLKRLSQLIRRKERARDESESKGEGESETGSNGKKANRFIADQKKRKALALYLTVASPMTTEDDKGLSIDKRI